MLPPTIVGAITGSPLTSNLFDWLSVSFQAMTLSVNDVKLGCILSHIFFLGLRTSSGDFPSNPSNSARSPALQLDGGTHSSTLPFGSEAQRTMAYDLTPLIATGFKLQTRMTWWLRSASGGIWLTNPETTVLGSASPTSTVSTYCSVSRVNQSLQSSKLTSVSASGCFLTSLMRPTLKSIIEGIGSSFVTGVGAGFCLFSFG